METVNGNFSLVVLLLFLGAAHGFYLTIIAIASVRHTKANLFLSIFLFAYSFNLFNAYLIESGYMLHVKFLMGTSMPFQFLVGPTFFLYVTHILRSNSTFRKVDWFHFTPAIVAAIVASPYYLKPAIEKVAYVSEPAVNLPIERAWYFGFQLFITTVYLILASRLFQAAKGKYEGWLWLKNTQTALWVLTGIYAVTSPLFFILDDYLVEIRSFFYLSISLFIHLVGFLMLRESHILGRIGRSKPELSLDRELITALKQKITSFMTEHKPWLNSDFTLREMSTAIESNSLYTSTVLNQTFGMNFNDFVNGYRVDYAKELLNRDEFKLFAVALESGFANKNSFNRVFKKLTGLTPSQYRENQVTI